MPRKLSLVLLIIVAGSTLFVATSSFAQSQVSEIEQKIADYQKKLDEVRKEKNTLNGQVQYLDTQAFVTSLRIEDTENKVDTASKEADILGKRIGNLDQQLNEQWQRFIITAAENYKQRSMSVLDLFLASDNINDAMTLVKYYRLAQDISQKSLVQTQETKLNFEEQKKLREEKQKELEKLQAILEEQTRELEVQKAAKKNLLEDTKNDEKKYQQLINQSLAELNAIKNASKTGVKTGPVKKGEVIGYVGNSGYPGCSSGDHLHFEVQINGQWANPENYLSSHAVNNQQDGGSPLGGGSWDWPLIDPIIVTQKYGTTPWSWRYAYSGHIHTGIDMISDSSSEIRAPADGTLYTSVQSCPGSSNINVKYIDHGGGVYSYYLHLR